MIETLFTFLGYFIAIAALFVILCLWLALMLECLAVIVPVLLIPVAIVKGCIEGHRAFLADRQRRQSSPAPLGKRKDDREQLAAKKREKPGL